MALLYVLQCNLAYALAMRATDGKTEPSGEFLNPYGKRLLAQGTIDLYPLIFRLVIHTRANIYTRLEYYGIKIPENSSHSDIFATMTTQSVINENQFLDPVFLDLGIEAYTYDHIEELRKENLELKRHGKRTYNMIPQAGFQEKVLTNDADIKIVGGARGGGKTFIALFGTCRYFDDPDVNMYGFRRFEADVKRGIWKSAKQVFRGVANFADTSFEAKFLGGAGATMKMEHLADLSKIKDRFRGAEMPYIAIEELAEFTKESMSVIFDLIGSNRSTTGLPSEFICTCNPVGRSNKLRWFLDWWIDPETDEAIPSRSGKIRYFCRYGEDVMEIAWGDTPEEVYKNPNAKRKIQSLTDNPDENYADFITSVAFINGDYSENKILQVADTKYMNRISSGGSKSVINDIRGVWRDVEESGALITMDDMTRFFGNTSQTNGIRCAGGDIAFKSDWFILWAMDGMHIIDLEARKGVTPEMMPDIIKSFLKRNDVPFENFAFDGDGVGVIIKTSGDPDLQKCHAFSNKGPANDKVSYRNRKSECAGILMNAFQSGLISIDEEVLRRTYTEKRIPFTVRDKLVEERMVLRWIEDENPRELIKKSTMKDIIGHSPDWIEGLIYCVDRVDNAKKKAKMKKRGLCYMSF